jgi:hypothetical protein
MGQSRSGATSNSSFLAALHSGLEQAQEARGGLRWRCAHFQFLGYCGWISEDRLCSWLLFSSAAPRLVRGPIPKLLCYLAAKSLRATQVEPVQTYSGERSDDPLRECDA